MDHSGFPVVVVQVVSDKLRVKQLQREVARLEEELSQCPSIGDIVNLKKKVQAVSGVLYCLLYSSVFLSSFFIC